MTYDERRELITKAYSHLHELQLYSKLLQETMERLAEDLANPEPQVEQVKEMRVWEPMNVKKGTD